jgi:hypothetical protein
MSYIGATPQSQTTTPAIDYFSGDGTTTSFTLSRVVASVLQMQVVVNNVIQNPSNAYTVMNNVITFTGAPSSGSSNIYVIYGSQTNQLNISAAVNSATSGATGGGTDAIFIQNARTINTSYTIPGSVNAQSTGPLVLANSAVVTMTGTTRWIIF